jgi:hypothetical protein
MQKSFRRNLLAEGLSADVHGYYLGVGKGHVPVNQVGEVDAFVGFEDDEVPCRVKAKWFFALSTILLVEHLFALADHPSLAGYEETESGVAFTFKPDNRDERLMTFTANLHDELVAYADFAWKAFGAELVSKPFVEWSLENVRRFACGPFANEVRPVAWLPTNREQSHDPRHTALLASPLAMRDLLKMVAYDLFPRHESHFSPKYSWNAGAVAISPAPIRWAYSALRMVHRGVGLLRDSGRKS